jgi:hypothetical protein
MVEEACKIPMGDVDSNHHSPNVTKKLLFLICSMSGCGPYS